MSGAAPLSLGAFFPPPRLAGRPLTANQAQALSDTFFWPFWSAGVYKIVSDAAQTTSPLVSREIIRFVQSAYAAQRAGEPVPGVGRGVAMAVGLFLMQLFVSVCMNNTFARAGQCGVLARAALISAACASSTSSSPPTVLLAHPVSHSLLHLVTDAHGPEQTAKRSR